MLHHISWLYCIICCILFNAFVQSTPLRSGIDNDPVNLSPTTRENDHLSPSMSLSDPYHTKSTLTSSLIRTKRQDEQLSDESTDQSVESDYLMGTVDHEGVKSSSDTDQTPGVQQLPFEESTEEPKPSSTEKDPESDVLNPIADEDDISPEPTIEPDVEKDEVTPETTSSDLSESVSDESLASQDGDQVEHIPYSTQETEHSTDDLIDESGIKQEQSEIKDEPPTPVEPEAEAKDESVSRGGDETVESSDSEGYSNRDQMSSEVHPNPADVDLIKKESEVAGIRLNEQELEDTRANERAGTEQEISVQPGESDLIIENSESLVPSTQNEQKQEDNQNGQVGEPEAINEEGAPTPGATMPEEEANLQTEERTEETQESVDSPEHTVGRTEWEPAQEERSETSHENGQTSESPAKNSTEIDGTDDRSREGENLLESQADRSSADSAHSLEGESNMESSVSMVSPETQQSSDIGEADTGDENEEGRQEEILDHTAIVPEAGEVGEHMESNKEEETERTIEPEAQTHSTVNEVLEEQGQDSSIVSEHPTVESEGATDLNPEDIGETPAINQVTESHDSVGETPEESRSENDLTGGEDNSLESSHTTDEVDLGVERSDDLGSSEQPSSMPSEHDQKTSDEDKVDDVTPVNPESNNSQGMNAQTDSLEGENTDPADRTYDREDEAKIQTSPSSEPWSDIPAPNNQGEPSEHDIETGVVQVEDPSVVSSDEESETFIQYPTPTENSENFPNEPPTISSQVPTTEESGHLEDNQDGTEPEESTHHLSSSSDNDYGTGLDRHVLPELSNSNEPEREGGDEVNKYAPMEPGKHDEQDFSVTDVGYRPGDVVESERNELGAQTSTETKDTNRANLVDVSNSENEIHNPPELVKSDHEEDRKKNSNENVTFRFWLLIIPVIISIGDSLLYS